MLDFLHSHLSWTLVTEPSGASFSVTFAYDYVVTVKLEEIREMIYKIDKGKK